MSNGLLKPHLTEVLGFVSNWGNFFKFIFSFEREREYKRGTGRERKGERERERIPSRLHTVSAELDVGLELTN